MLPLPKSFPLCYRTCSAVADSQFRVTVDTNKYSVPSRAASKKVSLEIYAQRVVVKDENEALLADHRRCFGFRREVTDPEHDRAFVLASRSGSERTLLTKFLGLGSGARKFLDGLREKVPNWNDHAKQILALEQVHGREKVARALLDCTEHNAYSASYIHNMLELRGRLSPDPGPLRVARREDLLELRVEEPDMSIYGKGGGNETV